MKVSLSSLHSFCRNRTILHQIKFLGKTRKWLQHGESLATKGLIKHIQMTILKMCARPSHILSSSGETEFNQSHQMKCRVSIVALLLAAEAISYWQDIDREGDNSMSSTKTWAGLSMFRIHEIGQHWHFLEVKDFMFLTYSSFNVCWGFIIRA